MTPEKVRELAMRLRFMETAKEVEDKLPLIMNWLEQNQPEPKVVGLSDKQISDFGAFVYGFDKSAKKLEDMMRDWHSRQTFNQPEAREVFVGLTSNQAQGLGVWLVRNAIEEFDAIDYANEILEWQKTQTFAQLKAQQPVPNWNDAPEWANWLAQDEDGRYAWYSEKPAAHKNKYDNRDSGYWEYTGSSKSKWATTCLNWQQTLQDRPKPQVEVGQVWRNQSKQQSEVIAVNANQVVRKCESGGFMITGMEDFITKFTKVSQ